MRLRVQAGASDWESRAVGCEGLVARRGAFGRRPGRGRGGSPGAPAGGDGETGDVPSSAPLFRHRVNDVVARHERTFLEGSETDLFRAFSPITVEGQPKDYFRPWSPDVWLATWESEAEGLVLIADYRLERTPIRVERSLKYAGPMTLHDAFTGEKVVQLTEGRWDFRMHLDELPVRLFYWKKGVP